jgi:hypothetical protein
VVAASEQVHAVQPALVSATKAVRLAKAKPSAKRTVDTVRSRPVFPQTARRVRQTVARRQAMLAAERIRTRYWDHSAVLHVFCEPVRGGRIFVE